MVIHSLAEEEMVIHSLAGGDASTPEPSAMLKKRHQRTDGPSGGQPSSSTTWLQLIRCPRLSITALHLRGDRQLTTGKYIRSAAGHLRDRQVRDRQVRDSQVRDRQVRDKQVPCSRSDVFASRQLSVVEKRKLMRFLTSCAEETEEQRAYNGRPYLEFLSDQKLGDNLQHFLLHSIAMVTEATPTEQGLAATRHFLRCLGRYGNTPFLFPVYGLGEIPQCFCRMCAVFGGIYCLRHSVSCLLLDTHSNRCKAVIDSRGQRISCSHVVLEEGFVGAERKRSSTPPRFLSRAVLITDGSILPTDSEQQVSLVTVPPAAGGPAVKMVELNLVHLTCPSVGSAHQDLSPLVTSMFRTPESPDHAPVCQLRCVGSGVSAPVFGSGVSAPVCRLRSVGSGLSAPVCQLRCVSSGCQLRCVSSGLSAPVVSSVCQLRCVGSGCQLRCVGSGVGSGLSAPVCRLRSVGSDGPSVLWCLFFNMADGSGVEAEGHDLPENVHLSSGPMLSWDTSTLTPRTVDALPTQLRTPRTVDALPTQLRTPRTVECPPNPAEDTTDCGMPSQPS
ncbi:hypothetical protein F7725_013675 [Dissostichus mawsoni]|uniref:RAE1/2 domain-containing protein n=1 Tax=Dissostichus mawsoni TaxID=36200 RepID=A0A7J5YWW1_DISMA|nr:hypothetical protein F7725_013675 [Dissostichus mawsoni]